MGVKFAWLLPMPQRPSRKKKIAPAAGTTPQAIQAERDRRKIERDRELAVNSLVDRYQGRKSISRA